MTAAPTFQGMFTAIVLPTFGETDGSGQPQTDLVVAPVDEAHLIEPAITAGEIGKLRPGAVEIFVPYRQPPVFAARKDGEVRAFHVASDLLEFVLRLERDGCSGPGSLLFKLLMAIDRRRISPSEIRIRQLGREAASKGIPPTGASSTVSWIIPHLGSLGSLRTCLDAIRRNCERQEVLVGLDGPVAEPIEEEYPDVLFFRSGKEPVGPYRIRNALARRARGDVLAFQDADDIPCNDRTRVQLASLRRGALVGCHQLTFDLILQCVTAVRYPVDARAALLAGPREAQLFPTCMIERDRFESLGGLSENLHHSLDTQFLLRSAFTGPQINVDEFLYIKSRHFASLKTHRRTGIGSTVRRQLWNAWRHEFKQVRAGEKRLSDSVLSAVRLGTIDLEQESIGHKA